MKKIKLILLSTAAILSLSSCNIERMPQGSMSSEEITGDPLESLPVVMKGTYAQMKDWSDAMHRCGEYAGDNIMIRGGSSDAFYEFISYARTPQNYRLTTFWNNSYKVIAQSSNIINMMDEGLSKEVDQEIGESYFLRGLMYFYLVRGYGRPYYDSPATNLGVPIVNGTPKELDNVVLPDRATVKAVYEQAISDLKKSATLMSIDKGPSYASQEAAYAILSRVYLYMSGSWATPNAANAKLSAEYAELVISGAQSSLLDRAEFMKYNTFTPENNKESIFVVKRLASEGMDHYVGIGGMYASVGGQGWGEMYASAKYLDLLNETGRNDWNKGVIVDARANFIKPVYVEGDSLVFRFIAETFNSKGVHVGYNYIQAGTKTVGGTLKAFTVSDKVETEFALTPIDAAQGMYSIVYKDGKTYNGVTDQYIALNAAHPMFYILKASMEGEESHLHSPVVTRLGEVYLNLAEAKAKQGDMTGALTALNVIRERSLPGEGYTSLSPDNYVERIEKERQLELAFQAERSYDVYRNGLSMTRAYPGPHKSLEVIQPNDYRVVYFIPQDAINSYMPNVLTQNPKK